MGNEVSRVSQGDGGVFNIPFLSNISDIRSSSQIQAKEVIASHVLSLKCVLLGSLSVGKTSLVNRLLHNSFDNNTAHTMGATRHTSVQNVGSFDLHLEIWDIGNIERYNSLLPLYLQHSSAQFLLVLLVYDISDMESYKKCTSLIKTVKTIHITANAPQSPAKGNKSSMQTNDRERDMTILVVGNKTDLAEKREVKEDDVNLDELGVQWCELSCKTGGNVQKPLQIILERINESSRKLKTVLKSNSPVSNGDEDKNLDKTGVKERDSIESKDVNDDGNDLQPQLRRTTSEPTFTREQQHQHPLPPQLSPKINGIDSPRKHDQQDQSLVFTCCERNSKTHQPLLVSVTLSPSKITIENTTSSDPNGKSANGYTTAIPNQNKEISPSSFSFFKISPVEGLFKFLSRREFDVGGLGGIGKRKVRVSVDTHHIYRVELYLEDGSLPDEKLVFLCRQRDNFVACLKNTFPSAVFTNSSSSISRDEFVNTYKEQCRFYKISFLRAVEELTESQNISGQGTPFSVLELSRILRESRQAFAVTEALRWNASLSTLDLSYNNLGLVGLGPLIRALPLLHSLTSLDISNNNMGSEAGPIFGSMLKRSPHLKRILIDGNALAEGASYIALAIMENNSLVTLGISHNKIDSDTAIAFTKTLVINTTLQSLDLSYNDIHEEASMPLLNALRCNTTLTRMAVLGNPQLSDTSVAALTIPKTPEVLAMLEEKKEMNLRGSVSSSYGSVGLYKSRSGGSSSSVGDQFYMESPMNLSNSRLSSTSIPSLPSSLSHSGHISPQLSSSSLPPLSSSQTNAFRNRSTSNTSLAASTSQQSPNFSFNEEVVVSTSLPKDDNNKDNNNNNNNKDSNNNNNNNDNDNGIEQKENSQENVANLYDNSSLIKNEDKSLYK